MSYVIEVAAAFRDERKPAEFEVWRMMMVSDAEGADKAVRRAVSTCRDMLDSPDNWRVLGYHEAPAFYAVVSVGSTYDEDLPHKPHLTSRECMIFTGMGTWSELELNKLVARQPVPTEINAVRVEDRRS